MAQDRQNRQDREGQNRPQTGRQEQGRVDQSREAQKGGSRQGTDRLPNEEGNIGNRSTRQGSGTERQSSERSGRPSSSRDF